MKGKGTKSEASHIDNVIRHLGINIPYQLAAPDRSIFQALNRDNKRSES